MVKFKDPDIMSACAEKIIDRLYELALCDTRIMVCDWLAYATLATYRLVNELTGESDLPTMDECFDGTAVTPELSDNPKWGILKYWHDFHWQRANTPAGESEYEGYFSIVALQLGDVMLSINDISASPVGHRVSPYCSGGSRCLLYHRECMDSSNLRISSSYFCLSLSSLSWSVLTTASSF